jgi:hypothetical protein
LSGGLESITDPFGSTVNYTNDKLGRLKQITGTPFGSPVHQSVTNYVTNIDYRAFGAVKHIDYGNNVKTDQTFDNRLRVSEFKVSNPSLSNSPTADYQTFIKKNYEYNNDNSLKFSDDNGSNVVRDPAKFDRSYSYDFAGRITSAKTGEEARGGTVTDRNEIPYKQTYAYNAFSNVTSRQAMTWTQTDNETNTWANDRNTAWSYDADGRLKSTQKNKYYYDAAGSVVMSTTDGVRKIGYLDGEGKRIRTATYLCGTGQCYEGLSEYFIYSSVLGKVLTELKHNGTKQKTNVYGVGGVVATQNDTPETGVIVKWEHQSPKGESYIESGSNGSMHNNAAVYHAELDPLGSNVGLSAPIPNLAGNSSPRWGDPFGGYLCLRDWFETPCSQVAYALSNKVGTIGPLDEIEHDGQGWGQYECPGGDVACGYYYNYLYNTNSLIDEDNPSLGSGPCINCGQAIYLHPADTYSGPFWFDLTGTNTPPPSQPPANPPPVNPPNSNPCLGRILNFTSPAGKDWGFRHITPRHIEQTAGFLWKSRYTFSPLERGLPKKQERVSEVDQKTVQNGAVNSSFNNTFVYIYAFPDFDYTIQGISGPIGVRGFEDIGIDNLHGGDTTNVNTVVVNSDCSNVITSYPGLPQNGGRINGNPRWWNPGRGWTWRR